MARLPLTDREVRFGQSRDPAASTLTPAVRVLEVEHVRHMAALPTGEDKQAVGGSYGQDGDSWYYNTFEGDDEMNPDLMGRNKYLTYRRMVKSDPAVRSLVWLYKLPIRSAEWDLKPASEDPADVAVAEFFGEQFGIGPDHPVPLLDLTWDESLNQCLECLPYGAQGEEMIWAQDLVEWTDADGDIHQLRPLARLAPRAVSTVDEIAIDEMTGLIKWIKQDLPNTKPIPGEKIAWYESERTPSRRGNALIRPAYGAWRTKRGIMIADAVAYDRFSSGVPVVRYPAAGGTVNKLRAENIGRNYRTHERAWVTFEGTAAEGWDLEIKNAAGTMADPISRLRHYDQQISMAGLQQFSSLGTTDTGSRAVGDTLSDPYYLAVQAIAKGIAATRMKTVLRRVCDVNFGADVKIPTLTVTKIEGRAVAAFARALADLSAAGLHFTDSGTQNDIRDRLDLRRLPDALAEQLDALPVGVGVAPIAGAAPAFGEGESVLDRAVA